MRCHYEVLALERDASAKEVKKAFHVQALRWHPDKHQKNNISAEEATLRFQEIQSAYEVLSDAHERKWYDDHREQILRGDGDGDGDSDGEGNGDELNLFKYFSPSVYSGFGKDEKSFYSVYSALFKKIDEMDIATVATSTNKPQEAPAFGDKRTPMEDVNYFYQHWASYITQRTFAWVDEYRTLDAPSRQIRRAMEKENKKLRDAAKKAFTTEVRELVDFVRRRDQRMIAFLKQKEKEKEQQKRDEEAKKKEKQEAYEVERLAFQQQERERWEAMESHQTSRHAQDHIEEELERMRKKMDADLLLCDLCRKTFKSAKQLSNHLVSKKHRDMEAELGIGIGGGSDYNSIEAELELELQAELAAARKQKSGAFGKDKAAQTSEEQADDAQDDEQQEQEETPEEAERREKEAEAARAAEEARLLKEQKAAEKRKERKEQRKQLKKEGVEKIVTGGGGNSKSKNAKDKDSKDKDSKDKDSSSKATTDATAKSSRVTDDWTDSEEEGNGKRGSRRKGGKGKKR